MNAFILTLSGDRLLNRRILEKHLSKEAFKKIQTGRDIYTIAELPPLGRNQIVELHGDEWKPPEECLTYDDVVICATCNKPVLFRDSWSPEDEALCSECDTEVTGREHGPTLPVTFEALRLWDQLTSILSRQIGKRVTSEWLRELQKEIEKVLNQTAEVFTKPNDQ
jgi:hypothetical protein